jgi:hypothetical protein
VRSETYDSHTFCTIAMRKAPTRKTTFNTKEMCKAERTKSDKLHRKQQVITVLFSRPKTTSPYFDGKQMSGCCFGLHSVRHDQTLHPLCHACGARLDGRVA